MKKAVWTFVKNTFLTTGITISLLAVVAFLLGGSCIFVITIFQNLLANACIHLAFLLTSKFESKYFLLDALLDVAMVAAIILLFGFVFNWFSSTPIWVLIIMVCITYAIGTSFQVFRAREDIDFINKKLKQRSKEKEG